MGKNLYKLTKKFWWGHHRVDFMTSSKLDSWKNNRISRVLAEYLKNGSTDFHKTYLSFRHVYMEGFEIEILKIDYSLLPC